MINNFRVLAFIPARGGSKGIKNKNIRLLGSKPLIYYTINAAKKSNFVDDVFVSTDSKRIANISKSYEVNVPFLRPKSLSRDNSNIIDCLMFSLNKLHRLGKNYDIVVILQPTSPLRTYSDIDDSLKVFIKSNKSIVSINKIKINPFLIRTIHNSKLKRLLNKSSTVRRQDLDKYYKVNGAIYINWVKKLNYKTSLNDNEVGYVMHTKHSIDVDTFDDLIDAKKLLNNN